MPKPTLTITLEGGLLTSVSANVDNFPFDVQVIDYDTEDANECDLTPVCQPDGHIAKACVWTEEVERTNVEVLSQNF